MFYLQLCAVRGSCFIAFITFSNTNCLQKWSNEAFLLKMCAACRCCPTCCSLFYRIEFLQDYMSLVVVAAGVCLALKAAKFAVGIHPAWHDTICCARWCWASRYSACASQLCWLLSSSSSASARSDKRLSLLQANVSSTLRVGWPACFLRPYYTSCFFPEKEGRIFLRNFGHTANFYMVPTLKNIIIIIIIKGGWT